MLFRRNFSRFSSIMGEELVWACKNGDLDQVKAIVGKPVRILYCRYRISSVLCYGVCVSAVELACGFARKSIAR